VTITQQTQSNAVFAIRLRASADRLREPSGSTTGPHHRGGLDVCLRPTTRSVGAARGDFIRG